MGVRRAFLLSLDALLASILIVGAILLYLEIDAQGPDATQSAYIGEDLLLSLGQLTVGELEADNPWITNLYASTSITENDSVLYAIGLLWVLEEPGAENFTDLINDSLPDGIGLRLAIEDETIIELGGNKTSNLVAVSRQQITGIDRGRPLAGSSASAYLKKLKDKQTNAITYFGGFTGQGNITVNLYLPISDPSTQVLSMRMEGDIPQEFDLAVNDVYCTTITPTTENMTNELWNISDCTPLLAGGNNSFKLSFDDLTEAYVAGGLLRATYVTDEFVTTTDLTVTRYDFPHIDGVVNLYDGIHIPGSLQELSAHLHYYIEDTEVISYLTLGEKTVWQSNATGEVTVDIDNATFAAAGIDFEQLSNTTVPLRFASFNASTQIVSESGNADVIIITDYSGSMALEIGDDSSTGEYGDLTDCEDDVYTNPNIRRSHLARCLDQEVVDIIMEVPGNRIYPVHFYNGNVYSYINPTDEAALISHYQTYTGSFPSNAAGGTGLASALSEAYNIFDTYSNDSRSKHIIFMSDGIPSHCARDPDYQWWWPWFGVDPDCVDIDEDFHPTSTCSGTASGSTCAIGTGSCQPAIDNTIVVADALNTTFNVTIHSVAFGPIESCGSAAKLLEDVANMTNGSYSASSDIDELRDVYKNISEQIIESIELQSQVAIIPDNVTPGTLYADSYIIASHTAPTQEPLQNEIEVTRQTAEFNSCNPSISLPSGVRYKDAKLLSYSGPHWTDLVTVNGDTAYDLTAYLVQYSRLGDPFRIGLPVDSLDPSTTLFVQTGDAPDNATGCSDNNSMVYTVYVPSATARTPVLEFAEGCTWTIETEENGVQVLPVPSSYAGTSVCSYTNAAIDYNQTDTLQVAVYQLLDGLDFDDDGRIFVSLDAEDLEIIITKVSTIPYLWGPVMMTAEVRQ